MNFGSHNTPDCTCGICLTLRRTLRDSHRREATGWILGWLRDELRRVHGAFLDNLEAQVPQLAELHCSPVPVAAGAGSSVGVLPPAPVPPVKSEDPKGGGQPSSPPVAGRGTLGEKGEDRPAEVAEASGEKAAPDLAAEDKAEKVEEESEDKAEAPKDTEEEEAGKSEEQAEKAQSSGIKSKKEVKDKKKKKDRKEEKQPRTPSTSPPALKRRRGPVDGQAAPESPEEPPRASAPPHPPPAPPPRRDRPRAIPAGRYNPALRGPRTPPGHWGTRQPGGSKGRVRRERWSDITTYGPSDDRKRDRERRQHR